jgi:hypothetical protein
MTDEEQDAYYLKRRWAKYPIHLRHIVDTEWMDRWLEYLDHLPKRSVKQYLMNSASPIALEDGRTRLE